MKIKALILLIFLKISLQITFPFNRENFTLLSGKNIHSLLFENKIQTNILIGTPQIKIPLNIKTQEYTLSIVSSNIKIKEKIPLFNERNSSSIKFFYLDPDDYLNEDFTFGSLGTETFNFGKENITLEQIQFLLAYGLNVIESGVLGLNLFYKNFNLKFTNIINQLKQRKIINESVFYFTFNDYNNGDLIIGEYPHESNNDKFNKDDFISFSIYIKDVNIQKYNFLFDKIFFNNLEIENNIECDVSIENGMIKVNKVLFEKIEEIFFEDYVKKNICEKVVLFNGNFSYICNEKLNVKKFKEVKFMIRRINFILDGNDLFYKFENKYYFLIYYGNDSNNCVIGKPFFNKYTLIFEHDKKTIGFYNSKNNKKVNVFGIFIVIFLFIVVLVLIVFIFIYINKRKTLKQKALEMNEEDFEYSKHLNDNNNKAFGF